MCDAHWHPRISEPLPWCDEAREVTVLFPQGQLMVSSFVVHFREELGASGDG